MKGRLKPITLRSSRVMGNLDDPKLFFFQAQCWIILGFRNMGQISTINSPFQRTPCGSPNEESAEQRSEAALRKGVEEREMATLARVCRKALTSTATGQLLLRRGYAAEASPAIQESADRVKWDYRGQRKIIPLGQWVPKIAVDAYVAPNVVLAGQVTIGDGSSVWNGSVLRGDLNKITVGFCCNIQERCVIHAAWSSPTGQGLFPLFEFFCSVLLVRKLK